MLFLPKIIIIQLLYYPFHVYGNEPTNQLAEGEAPPK